MTKQQAETLQDGLQKLAGMLKIFYDALITAGFDKEQAMQLTLAHMSFTLNK